MESRRPNQGDNTEKNTTGKKDTFKRIPLEQYLQKKRPRDGDNPTFSPSKKVRTEIPRDLEWLINNREKLGNNASLSQLKKEIYAIVHLSNKEKGTIAEFLFNFWNAVYNQYKHYKEKWKQEYNPEEDIHQIKQMQSSAVALADFTLYKDKDNEHTELHEIFSRFIERIKKSEDSEQKVERLQVYQECLKEYEGKFKELVTGLKKMEDENKNKKGDKVHVTPLLVGPLREYRKNIIAICSLIEKDCPPPHSEEASNHPASLKSSLQDAIKNYNGLAEKDKSLPKAEKISNALKAAETIIKNTRDIHQYYSDLAESTISAQIKGKGRAKTESPVQDVLMEENVSSLDSRKAMEVNFKIASGLDVHRLADDFHDALKPEKQPEDLYRVLQSLLCESEAINQLDNAYTQKYGKTLENALKERFGKPEDSARQKYALQLINKGSLEAEQVTASSHPSEEHIHKALHPASGEPFSILRYQIDYTRIYTALHPALGEPKIETIYAALTPYNRNAQLLCKLNELYTHYSPTSLRLDIENTLKGDPKDYALFLIGDQTLEKKIMSWSEAVSLQKALSKQTFRRDDGVHIPVPYDYLREGGAHWTHTMCQALKEVGYESEKIIALSLHTDEHGRKLPNLHVYTDLAPDMPDGQDPMVTLMYHIAPLIQVEASFGMVELILDPSLSSKPLTIKQWMGKMGQNSFERISLDTYKTKLGEESQKNLANPYPADRTYVFTGRRNIHDLPSSPDNIDDLLREKPVPDQDTSDYYQRVGEAAMSKGAAWVPYHRMARSIREHMQSIHDDLSAEHFLNTIATNFLKDVSTFHPISNTNFSSAFLNLYKNLQTHLADTHISTPIVERFEKLLSSKHALSGANIDQHAFPASSVYEVGIDIRMSEYQSTDKGKTKDTEDQIEVLQKEVNRWPLEEISIERIQRPIFFRDCKITDVLDFEQLADDFDIALKTGKQPEDLYRVLQSLLCESEAINKLDNAYTQKYRKTLKNALDKRFGKSEDSARLEFEDSARLEYALQLINKGNSRAVEVIEPLSVHPSKDELDDELDKVAQRIHLALTQLNPQPEVVYAALTPFERNTELLYKLDELYKWDNWHNYNFRTSLKSHIEDTLKENLKAKDYALFLIGDQVMEKQEISHYEAMRLWKVVERLTFDSGDGVRIPVPYDHPYGGWCPSRVHIMAQALKEMGYASKKIYAQFLCYDKDRQKQAGFHVNTDLAADMPHGEPPTFTCWYHVAPCIQMKTAAGNKETFILDPSLSSKPLTPKNWMSKLGQDSYASITFEDFQSKMEKERQDNPQDSRSFPAGQAYLFTTSRNYNDLPDLEDIENALKHTYIPDQYGSEWYDRKGKGGLINDAKWVPYNRIARSIREELRNPTIQDVKDADAFLNKLATNFLADVSKYRSSTSSAFSNAFPNLYKDLIEHVKTRTGHPSDSSILELFRKHLSGGSHFDKED